MLIISVYNCSKSLKNFSQSLNSLSVATILTDSGFSKPTDEKTQKLSQTKPKQNENLFGHIHYLHFIHCRWRVSGHKFFK